MILYGWLIGSSPEWSSTGVPVSMDRWRQMPPGKSCGGVKIENWGEILLVANFLETHGTKCDNSAYNSPIFFPAHFARRLLNVAPYFQGCISEERWAGSTAHVILNFNVTILCTTVLKKFSARFSHRLFVGLTLLFNLFHCSFAFIILTACSKFRQLILLSPDVIF